MAVGSMRVQGQWPHYFSTAKLVQIITHLDISKVYLYYFRCGSWILFSAELINAKLVPLWHTTNLVGHIIRAKYQWERCMDSEWSQLTEGQKKQQWQIDCHYTFISTYNELIWKAIKILNKYINKYINTK